jgi:diguanylate cyclase (GGDEF)-like protein
MKLHPSISKNIREFFLSQGVGKGVAYMTFGSILVSVLMTALITNIFRNPVGLLGYSLAILIPAVIASVASYFTLSLYFELEQSRMEIRELAITDDLTQVFNRRYFFELVGRELERSRRNGTPLAIVLFDIDDFKLVNDNHGHLAGDLVLQEMCSACQVIVRPYDIFARFGGEEFVFLLPDTDESRARAFAERLRQLIARQVVVTYNDSRMQITISIGVAVFNSKMDTVDDLISRADRALYKAKGFGKNRLEIG